MDASPDGLVIDPGEQQPHGLVEIKCPARAEKLSLFDLCTKKEYKSTFCLQYTNEKYELKKQKNYYYQIQGQLHNIIKLVQLHSMDTISNNRRSCH